MAEQRRKLIWVVAAGTGGHIFPGLRIAEALERIDPKYEFLFFGSRSRLESTLVPKHNRKIQFLKASPWKGKGLLSRLFAIVDLALGFCQVYFSSFSQKPAALISVGGYVSVPVALAAYFRGAKIFLIEPNIRAGVSNKIVSKFAQRAFSTPGSDASQVFKCSVDDFGNPVRETFELCEIRSKATRILVLGGSQGAKALCDASLRAAAKLNLAARGISVLLQSGAAHFDSAQQLKSELKLGDRFEIRPFVDRVDEELKKSDIVLARAGAMTVAELSVAALPTIFVPFPFAADDHQRVNALLLEKDGAARCVDERDPSFQSNLEQEIELLLGSQELRRSRSQALQKWGRPGAAEAIARAILAGIS